MEYDAAALKDGDNEKELYGEDLTEKVAMTFTDAFILGLGLGMGFGAALLIYGIFALMAVKVIIEAGIK